VDIFYFVIFILVLAAIFIFLMRWEKRIKARYKDKAIIMLETTIDPDPKEVKETIKYLRLYSGRIKKDHEALNLIRSLQNKYNHLL
jgi:hypothetical protein